MKLQRHKWPVVRTRGSVFWGYQAWRRASVLSVWIGRGINLHLVSCNCLEVRIYKTKLESKKFWHHSILDFRPQLLAKRVGCLYSWLKCLEWSHCWIEMGRVGGWWFERHTILVVSFKILIYFLIYYMPLGEFPEVCISNLFIIIIFLMVIYDQWF